MNAQNEIVLYRPDDTMQLEVQLGAETVWLTQAQMVMLFERDQSVISRHISAIFREGELDEKSNMHFLHNAFSDKPVAHYNLDVIISVGYRVKSRRGTEFRIWATKVLREYLLQGRAINQRFERIEQRLTENEKQIAFFVRTAIPPKEGVFFDGQIFDAHVFVSDLVKSARRAIVVMDNYVDETVLVLLSKREKGVAATIFTRQISQQLKLDAAKHNAQYEQITLLESSAFHDRFVIVDDTVYHLGASLKDLGKKLFAFSKMEMHPMELLKAVNM